MNIESLNINTEPSSEPVTLSELKTHLRIDSNDENEYISSLGKAARQFVESFTRHATIQTTYNYKLDCFPSSDILLPRYPLLSVSQIQYVDNSGSNQTWSSSKYVVDTGSKPGRVRLAYSQTYPTARNQPQAITITFLAGYADASSVPETLKLAIKMLVAHWYEQREPVIVGSISSKIPFTVENLLWQFRIPEFK